MDKNIWGSDMWHTMNFVALGYPKGATNKDKTNYKNFYENIVNVIPCQECSVHLNENLKNTPINNYLNSREKLFEWTVLLHNSVNKHLGKPEWTNEKAYNYYTNPHFNLNDYVQCFNWSYSSVIVLLIIIIILFFTKNIIIKKFNKLIK